MRHAFKFAIALAVLALVGPAFGAQDDADKCAVAGSKTLFANPKARVFTRTFGPERSVRTQVCRMSDGRHFGLAQDVGDLSRERVKLIGAAGNWLSYTVTRSSSSGAEGACRFKIGAGERRCAVGYPVHGIGVTRTGTLAWLADSGAETCCTVFRLKSGAKDPEVLDSGNDIERSSFAVGGDRAYWTKAGEPKSASLR